MITVESALALFVMLAFSSGALFISRRTNVPHTVVLVAIGVLMGLATLWGPLAFLDDVALTPELLFYFFLPILIFESAFNINIRRLTEDTVIISLLSVVSLIISTFAIAWFVDLLMSWIGLDVPFILALVFGAIISATDPVAVLALFKEYGAPRRLSLIFEGESIFNDGTAVAVFLIVLAIAESGVVNAGSITMGIVSFGIMVLGGIIVGLIFGGVFAKLVGYARSNEFAAITLTMVLAHLTFICSELFSEHASVLGYPIHVSAIIATAVASLLMGNYGRFKLPVHAHEFVEKYWAQFAFLANSIIFILIGMLALKLPAAAPHLMVPAVLAIIAVAAARALSIYPVVGIFNVFTKNEHRVPRSWQHMLAWGSLRGALAVTMVLLIPDTMTFPGWSYSFTPKEFVLTLTIGCIFTTLFIKATTIGELMRRLKLDTLTPLETVNYREMLIYTYRTAMKRLGESYKKGYVNSAVYERLKAEQEEHAAAALTELATADVEMLSRVIDLHAIGIERKYLFELFKNNEVPESVAKRIYAKLEYQGRAIERGNYNAEKYEHGRDLDVFELLAEWMTKLTGGTRVRDEQADLYMYYRSLSIISRKVAKELPQLDECFGPEYPLAHERIRDTIARYDSYREGSMRKLADLAAAHPILTAALEERFARRAILKHETQMLHNLREREMVTPKVYVALEERFGAEST
jgi:CPA1 family monovalent cation:H+ antiporter